MNQLLKRNLTKSKKSGLLIIIVFCLIFSISPIAIFSISNMYHEIHADIVEHSRGSYDLLVRSPNAITDIEKELGIVPENYLGGGRGGISLKQWESIKNRNDIEIAAPVASLGYFTGINSTLGVLPSPEGPSAYRVEYSTTDGVNDYLYATYEQVFLESLGNFLPFDVLANQPEVLWFKHEIHALFPLPVTYNHLVGIDSVEESKLSGIHFTDIKYGEEKKGVAQGFGSDPELLNKVHVIPVMQLQNSDVVVKAEVEVGKLPFTKEDTRKFLEQYEVNEIVEIMDFDDQNYQQFFEEINSTPKVSEIFHELDLTGMIKPFNAQAAGIVVKEDGELVDMEEYADSTSYGYATNWNNITKYYLAEPVEYQRTANGLGVEKLGEENGIPVYRSVEEVGMGIREASQDYEKLEVMTDAVGYYEIDEVQESLASSPLGIYQLEPVKYTDESGEEITLTPTFTAGSFVTAPAEGVTNIESAEFVKGDKPIDAIRVKVAGFDDYSPEAAKKIEQIADEIIAMGLHVDVVAGSSLQTIDVEVEGVGTVQESWTTLGASGDIVGQWDITNLLLAVIFIVVSMIYVINRIKIWSTDKIEAIERFKILGWEHKDIKRLYQKEIYGLLIISIILSFLAVAGFMYANEQYFSLLLIQVCAISVLVLIILILVEQQLSRTLQGRKKEKSSKVHVTSSLVVRNVLYYRRNIVSTFFQILLVSSLVSIVYLSLTQSVSQSNLTLLGQYVNAGVSEWNKLIIVGTYILTGITLVENISTMLLERKGEINNFKILGWSLPSINQMYLKEISLWAGIALVIGSILSFILFFIFYPLSIKSISFILLTGICLYMLIMIVSYSILRKRLKHSAV